MLWCDLTQFDSAIVRQALETRRCLYVKTTRPRPQTKNGRTNRHMKLRHKVCSLQREHNQAGSSNLVWVLTKIGFNRQVMLTRFQSPKNIKKHKISGKFPINASLAKIHTCCTTTTVRSRWQPAAKWGASLACHNQTRIGMYVIKKQLWNIRTHQTWTI